MAQLLGEIQWSEPILPRADDAAWEAEIRRRGGRVAEVDRRVAPSPWVREACLGVTIARPSVVTDRMFHIGAMVTSQENSCRYCYGANRAYLKILGYSEAFISRIERDAHLAELDEKERAFIAFCRNLARSRPRPALAERDALMRLGYSRLEVHEMALLIAMGCFYNRIGLLTACPPEAEFERMANGPIGRLIGFAGPLLRLLSSRRGGVPDGPDEETLACGPFGAVLAPLAGLPGALVMRTAIDGAFASTVLSGAVKALMFAVVARSLACRTSEAVARQILAEAGYDAAAVEGALATLSSDRLPQHERALLAWARDTVHYQIAAIQKRTRALAAGIGSPAALEAIGVAALANAVVRLAMLAE
jgi:hypothetical protein